MKILLMVTALTLASASRVWTRTTDLPHPWLTLDRSAKVLSLQCKPPEEASLRWRAVDDLRLSAFLPQHSVSSNISLVNVTSNMKEPKVNDLFTIHRVTFQGSWPTVSVSLDFLFPVTDKELGRYFCMVHYSDKDDKLSTFTTEMVVNQDLVSSHIDVQPKNVNGFSVKAIETHEVKVTWTKPESPKFTEASVSRMLVDKEGTPMAPSMSLLTTNGIRQLVYNSDVLLAKFNPRHSGNLSITLYVESDAHSQSYRYTCRVPYPACTGHRADSCTCCQGATNPDTPECTFSSEDSPVFKVLFFIVLALFLPLVCVVAVASICFYRYKFNKTDNTCVQKIFTPRRKTTDAETMTDPIASSEEESNEQNYVDKGISKRNGGRDRTGERTISRQEETVEAPETYSNRNSGSEPSRYTVTVHVPTEGTSSARSQAQPFNSLAAVGVTATACQEEKEVVTGTSTDNRGKNRKTRASETVAFTPYSQSHESEGARSEGHASHGSLPPAGTVRDEKRLNFEGPSKGSSKVESHEIEEGAVGGSTDNDLYASPSDSARERLLGSSNTPKPEQNTVVYNADTRPLLGNLEQGHNT